MTLGKKPKRYRLRTGDRFAVTPKSGRGSFSFWPALLFVIIAAVYYINTQTTDPDAALIANQILRVPEVDGVVTGTVPAQ